ncbi:MAG: hypothetical protein ABSA21_02205 [Candidatus Limnocylindrales bacterium]
MTGKPSSDAHENSRWRRWLPLLLLLLLVIALAWTCRGAVDTCPQGRSPAPSVAASSATSFGSPIVSTPAPTAIVATPAPSVIGGGSGIPQAGGSDFKITGSGVRNLVPGVTKTIALTLTNPNGIPIYVTALTVTVSAGSTPPGCASEGNLRITQSNASGADPIAIPANGSVTLTSPPRAPRITLLNLPAVNQDACKNKTFVLTYSGSAHS